MNRHRNNQPAAVGTGFRRRRWGLDLTITLILVAGTGCAVVAPVWQTVPVTEPDPPKAPPPPSPGLESFQQAITSAAIQLDMVAIPAKPAADGAVEIPSFWISKTEIPWDLYDIFVYELDKKAGETTPEVDAITRPSRPYVPPDRGYGHEGYPAISMTRYGAEQFCVWLSARTGRTYRLPTSAEWRHACRAGLTDEELKLVDRDEVAWHDGNADWKTQPVGKKAANPWGLHDMLGNASEWIAGETRESKPQAMGGNWQTLPGDLSSEHVLEQQPSWNASDPQIPKSKWWLADCGFVGFRVVCESEPNPKPESEQEATTGPQRY